MGCNHRITPTAKAFIKLAATRITNSTIHHIRSSSSSITSTRIVWVLDRVLALAVTMANSCTVLRKGACKDSWGWVKPEREPACHHQLVAVQGGPVLPKPRTSHTRPRMLEWVLAGAVSNKAKARAKDNRKDKGKVAKDRKDRDFMVTGSVQGVGV